MSAGGGGLLFEAGQKILCIGDSITDRRLRGRVALRGAEKGVLQMAETQSTAGYGDV